MLNMDCKNCDGRCCTSRKRELYVVLTSQEKDKFKDFSIILETAHGALNILKKTESGDCIFYDAEKRLCESYQNRPFECGAYPLMINFNERIEFIFDSAGCPKAKECSFEEIEKIKQEWLLQNIPLNWIKAYSEIG